MSVGEGPGVRVLDSFFSSQPDVLDWGIASLASPLPNAQRLRTWVAEGKHAGLRYMEEKLEQRADPSRLAPWAKSAVLFSLRQPAPFGTATGDFRVASYALGEDYHRRARRILDKAVELLQTAIPEIRCQGFCDTWPVFERDLAAEAGLGWRGKNTCLIHRRHGSGFLLAGFLTDWEAASPQAISQDFCGGCTACLEACPTGALPEPGRLDANKCISYWTIEHKGEIPDVMAEKSGTWIFGCDICQEVCPWNKKSKGGRNAAPGTWPKTSTDWLSLLREGGGFQSRFKGTPLLRAGRRAMLRNVRMALRNAPPSPSNSK